MVVNGTGSGNYQTTLTNLNYNKYYMFRAYAIQNGQPVYGEVLSFTTAFDQAKVNTSAVTNIGYNSATLNASVASVGSPAITERGFCYYSTYHKSNGRQRNKSAGPESG